MQNLYRVWWTHYGTSIETGTTLVKGKNELDAERRFMSGMPDHNSPYGRGYTVDYIGLIMMDAYKEMPVRQ